MLIISTYFDIAFIPFVFVWINIFITNHFYRTFKWWVLCLAAVVIVSASAFVIPESNECEINIITSRSNSEIFSLIFSCLIYCAIIWNSLGNNKIVNYILRLFLIVSSLFLYFGITYFILFPFIELIMLGMIILKVKDRSQEYIFVFFVSYVSIMVLSIIAMANVNWKGYLPDLRGQKILCIINDRDGNHYNIRGIDMPYEDRILKTIENKPDGIYYFYLDSLAAYSFSRTSLKDLVLYDEGDGWLCREQKNKRNSSRIMVIKENGKCIINK